jgi:NitT/TauT family transport system substrate-binding protein
LDDFPFWVAERFGYFVDEGIETSMEPGLPNAETPITTLVDHESDFAYPWPGAYAVALGRNLPLISVWQMCGFDPFAFAIQAGAGITDLKGLEGKSIAIAHENWRAVCIPEIAQNGDVDPSTVSFVIKGGGWSDAVANGEAEAALVWEGLRARLSSRGLSYEYLLGRDFSIFPGNSFVVRRSDLEYPQLKDLYVRYLRCWAKGLEIARTEPGVATQILWEMFPSLREDYADSRIAAEALSQLTQAYMGDQTTFWGLHDYMAWERFREVFEQVMGEVPGAWPGDDPFSFSPQLASEAVSESPDRLELPQAEDMFTNELAQLANEFDRDAVRADAESFELSPDFEGIPSVEV